MGIKAVGHFICEAKSQLAKSSKHIKANKNAMVAPDGLFWAKAPDVDILIVD
jgi:hypothetical protein